MRTRIALVAIVPVALITVTTLEQAATVLPARGDSTPSHRTEHSAAIVMPPDKLVAFRGLTQPVPTSGNSNLLFDLNTVLVPHRRTGATNASTAAPPTSPAAASIAVAALAVQAPGITDTVTPDQRAAWQRVAMCEEGGNWASNGGRFSGGLGITRTNWEAFGGEEFASEGAMATEDQQIMVAERIETSPPDQDGCRGW